MNKPSRLVTCGVVFWYEVGPELAGKSKIVLRRETQGKPREQWPSWVEYVDPARAEYAVSRMSLEHLFSWQD